jgi:hypothetical protein
MSPIIRYYRMGILIQKPGQVLSQKEKASTAVDAFLKC